MDELSEILKNNRTDDLTWFCSLSESELDLLISLKKLAIQHAKISGHQELADKFDLTLLRALGLVLMEYVRKRVQDDTCLAPSVVHQLMLLDNCNLLKTHEDDTVDMEEILTQICENKSKKKARKRLEAVEASCCNGWGAPTAQEYKKMELAKNARSFFLMHGGCNCKCL